MTILTGADPNQPTDPAAGPGAEVTRASSASAAAGATLPGRLAFNRADALVAFLLFALGAAAVMWASALIDPSIVARNKVDIWMDADSPRVFANMTDSASDHYRTSVHPLFSIASYLPTTILSVVAGVGPLDAVRAVEGLAAGLWLALLFGAMRIAGLCRLDAVLFAALASVSASAMFFATVPETYVFGSITILLMIIAVIVSERRPISPISYCAAIAGTLSMTTSNMMVGAIAAVREMGLRRAIPFLLCAIAAVTIAWGAQKALFPTSHFFLGDQEEGNYMAAPGPERAGSVFNAFFLHSMILPDVELVESEQRPGIRVMSVQRVPALQGGAVRVAGILAWIALMVVGIVSLVRARSTRKVIFLLGATIAGQFALHLVYGAETVLYSLHYLPVLILLVAIGSALYWRKLARGLVAIVIVCAAVSNFSHFSTARAVLADQGTERQLVQAQMRLRPDDAWPRGVGHAVIGFPGSAEADKSYGEPGGSFSPRVGSFGIQLWLVDAAGTIVDSSDSIALAQTQQSFSSFPKGGESPGVAVRTPFYQLTWRIDSDTSWTGRLARTTGDRSLAPVIALRSVGPAGGPIRSLRRRGDGVLINDRWLVELSPAPASIRLGSEGKAKLSSTVGSPSAPSHDDPSGWGIAALTLANTDEAAIRIRDLAAPSADDPESPDILDTVLGEPHPVEVDVPDARFVESLRAQEAQLLMGLVGTETRPADPTTYPVAWQRDAAYVVLALARIGRDATARKLAEQLRAVDFFGGFGAEADAPGLGLWVLSELATLAGDAAATGEQWPDVVRKATIIEEMLTAAGAVNKDFVGPLVPSIVTQTWLSVSTIADPARDGLIQGKMDFGRPVFYVNAVSYLGLVRAARIADSLGKDQLAGRWAAAAESIRKAWIKKFAAAQAPHRQATTLTEKIRSLMGLADPDYANDRTWVAALWPSRIAASVSERVEVGLRARWRAHRRPDGGFKRRPQWTYFDIAETHQWLELGDRAKVWATLDWFWDHQPAPGLYMWWEGRPEWNSYGRWDEVRGWVNPANTVPHYWSAAEMLLLQLDMLVSWRRGASGYVLTIGSGVPDAWLANPMSVRRAPVPGGFVTWRWDGSKLSVDIESDQSFEVKTGSALPPPAELRVSGRPRAAR